MRVKRVEIMFGFVSFECPMRLTFHINEPLDSFIPNVKTDKGSKAAQEAEAALPEEEGISVDSVHRANISIGSVNCDA